MEDTMVEGVTDVSRCSVVEGSQVQQVIGLLLAPKSDDPEDSVQQTDFPLTVKIEKEDVPSVDSISIASESPLDVSSVTLAGADILLASGDAVEHTLESNGTTDQLEDDNSEFVQGIVVEESDTSEAVAKFIDGQAVQLEDGTTAFIHTAPREGLQAVQLEDGTMAYLSHAGAELFNGEASGLEMEQLASSELPDEMTTEEKDNQTIKVSVGIIENPRSIVNSSPKPTTVNEKAFRCPYEGCFRLYTTLHHLKVHERSHTGDRPFPCTNPGCPKAFATAYGLKSHTRVHTGETPYRCPESNCCKAFKTSGDLQKHVRTHTGERPFKCPFNGCDRAFTTSNIRKVHIRTHTGERPYVCKEDGCNRAFASATNFKNHIRIHTGEKPYVCTIEGCNKRFTEYSSLYKHNVVHTHSKPYVCNLCSKTYRQTSTLAMHKRTVHGIVENGEDIVMDTSSVDDSEPVGSKDDVFEESSENNRIEFQLGTDISEDGNIVLHSVGDANSPPVYTVQVQQDIGLPTSTHQILVVTDPSQLAALQQFAQQVQLEDALAKSGGEIVTSE